MKYKNKKIKLLTIITLIIVAILFAFAFIKITFYTYEEADTTDKLVIHYINVGQGDSMLLQSDGENLLIDAGPKSNKDNLLKYLKKTGIKKLDYIIATHPHEDHIGNMGSIVDKYGVSKKIFAPKKTSTTSSYKTLVESISNANKKITIAKAGVSFNLGDAAFCEILAPNSNSYDNTNDYSAVIKVTFGKTSFLFTGDAEKTSEREILGNNPRINVDVLKVGHHGSTTSTTDKFLKVVSPMIAIISCGNNNEYGHPHNDTLQKLKENNITIFRTDFDGTIVLESDGNKIIKR